ncbi:MAG TPA: hypothetical protein VH107_01430 [Lacipirellulaceae bacterium]|jgi:hypothetical protein|nr:hypothetical protein [Lacipirellulaceae bacterium]
MKHRKLRIAWSVAWGLGGVLLFALWVRSFWWRVGVSGTIAECYTIIEAESGEFTVNVVTHFKRAVSVQWYGRPIPFDESHELSMSSKAHGGFGFWWWNYGNGFGLKISLLWPMVIAALSGLLPWAALSKRFSLRTLLIVTTLVALVLGLIMSLR